MRIDGVEYRQLGNNQLQNIQTGEIVDSRFLEAKNIYLGSYNDQRGMWIRSNTVNISLCPNLSPRVWSIISKVVLGVGAGLLLTGIAVIATSALPVSASVTFMAIGILFILGALLKMYCF